MKQHWESIIKSDEVIEYGSIGEGGLFMAGDF